MTYEELGIENDKPGWTRKDAPLWHSKVKKMWWHMWDRCRNPNRRDYIHYCKSNIYDDFRYLSKYIEWVKTQPRFEEFCLTCHEVTWEIDKDIKKKDNKDYYPEYMTLCPKYENLSDRANRFDYSKLGKSLITISIEDGSILIFSSKQDAVRKGFTESSIRKCLSGEFSQHKGYKWYFLKRIKL